MLQSEEWAGGLRDRVLPVHEKHRRSIDSAIETNVFGYHEIDE